MLKSFKQRARQLVAQMTLQEKCNQLHYQAAEIERLSIPAYNWWNECLHGVARSGVATVFPQPIAMAASFDEKLLNEVATAISDEARAKYNEYKKFGDTLIYQGLTYWSPNINIFRDPRWGRGHETYGEDPLLTGRMGTAFIKGLQEGDDKKYRKLDATIKHYAVHSGPENERHFFDAKVSEFDLNNTYLWAFKYCIDNAKPAAVMGAYNKINGEPACASKTYLKDYLYNELGFNGYVVSDCGAITDIHKNHKATENMVQSVALAIKNGCQLLNEEDKIPKSLAKAVEQGLLTENDITFAVEKLFLARFELGMFDDDCVYDNIPYSVVDCDKHRDLNRKMAQKSIVLLKNNGVLPLKGNEKLAVIGPNANETSVLLGNYSGTMSEHSTILNGLQNATKEKVLYAKGCDYISENNNAWEEKPLREAIIAAKYSDVIIMCMGISPHFEGEETDAYNGTLSGDKQSIAMPKVQQNLLREVAKLNKPIIFVNVSGSCLDLNLADEKADAVLQCFYLGAQGGNALADILYGKVSPSAKLPVTFYNNDDELVPFEDYSMKNRTYKYFNGKPLYPFGHGLNYGTVNENWLDENTVLVENTNEYNQNYIVLKYENTKKKKLMDFCNIELKPHEKRKVHFNKKYF